MTMIRSVTDAYILLLICICVCVCVYVRGLQFVIVYMYHFLKKARTADGFIECSIMSLKNCTILTKSILEKYMKIIYILFEFFVLFSIFVVVFLIEWTRFARKCFISLVSVLLLCLNDIIFIYLYIYNSSSCLFVFSYAA